MSTDTAAVIEKLGTEQIEYDCSYVADNAAAKDEVSVSRASMVSYSPAYVGNNVYQVDFKGARVYETSEQQEASAGYRFAKRFIDIAVSVFAIVIAAIPVLVLSVAIMIESHGSPFYVSHRVGRNSKPLNVLKLRTMVSDSNNFERYFTLEQEEIWHKEHKVDNDPRITRIGKFLRQTSLDELPQFINVLFGQMSIVGPRPVTEEELRWFSESQRAEFLSVKPGVTGLWQVSGRNDLTFESGKRQRMELRYVRNRGFGLDFSVFCKTFAAIFEKTGK
jgi:lipopolysaccharide/colanic/teichoic acid biosynthesis glycosyltransferase